VGGGVGGVLVVGCFVWGGMGVPKSYLFMLMCEREKNY